MCATRYQPLRALGEAASSACVPVSWRQVAGPRGQVWASISWSRVIARTPRHLRFGLVGQRLSDRLKVPIVGLDKAVTVD